MNLVRAGRHFGVALTLIASCNAFALADQSQVQVTQSVYGFSSPGNTYGPWRISDLQFTTSSTDHSLTVDVSHRNDNDKFFPTSGNFGSVSYTQVLSDRVYVNGAVGAGSGDPFATSVAHLEGDYKANSDRRLVLSVAADAMSYKAGTHTNDIGAGFAYYWPKAVLQLREYSVANTNSTTRLSTQAALAVYPNKRQQVALTLIAGPESFETVVPNAPPAYANFNGFSGTVTLTQQVSDHLGIIIGGYVSNFTQVNDGAPVAAGRGITLGFSVK